MSIETNEWWCEKSCLDFSENLPKDLKSLRQKIELMQYDDGLVIIALAISNDDELNLRQSIPAGFGDPINANVYDMVKDYYYVYCMSYFEIGSIPINYKLSIKGIHEWMIDVPLPLNIVERYLEDDQKKDYEEWKKSLGNNKDFIIETIQVVNDY